MPFGEGLRPLIQLHPKGTTMNKDRRKAIAAIIAKIEEAAAALEEVKSELETVKDEEREYYEGMPESIQSGTRGEAADAAATALEEAFDSLEGIASTFEEITSALSTASE